MPKPKIKTPLITSSLVECGNHRHLQNFFITLFYYSLIKYKTTRIKKMKYLTFALHSDGYWISRCGSELAWPILDYELMTPENSYAMIYNLDQVSVFKVGKEWDLLKWTKKVSREVKNIHRAFWGMNPLSGPLNKWELEA